MTEDIIGPQKYSGTCFNVLLGEMIVSSILCTIDVQLITLRNRYNILQQSSDASAQWS